jgi:ADP-ribosyl-[dinitrogen reductase] hydrolase
MKGTRPELADGYEIDSNGNGSLIRISPLIFELENKSIQERFQIVKLVSSITHGHVRSIISCFYYLEFALKVKQNIDKFKAYKQLKFEFSEFLNSTTIIASELKLFDRLLVGDIYKLQEIDIKSSGYVINTLEAGIWSILTTNSYSEAVLKAINLGKDTDTTGAVTGGLAGMIYSFNDIPTNWLNKLARKLDIEKLADRLETKYASH